MSVLLEFEIGPWKPWSVNELTNTRQGNAIRSKQKRWWKDAATAAMLDHIRKGNPNKLGPSNIQVAIPFTKNITRRDPHNYTGTVVKAIIDGLVNKGQGLWPDDDPRYVTVLDPICYVGTVVQINITPR